MSTEARVKIACPTCHGADVTVSARVAERHAAGYQIANHLHECGECKKRRVEIRAWVMATEPAGKRRDMHQGFRDRSMAIAMAPVYQRARYR